LAENKRIAKQAVNDKLKDKEEEGYVGSCKEQILHVTNYKAYLVSSWWRHHERLFYLWPRNNQFFLQL